MVFVNGPSGTNAFFVTRMRSAKLGWLCARHDLDAFATGTMPEAQSSVSQNIKIGVGASRRLFARHVLDAEAFGAMLEATTVFSTNVAAVGIVRGLLAQHVLDADATGAMLEAKNIFP